MSDKELKGPGAWGILWKTESKVNLICGDGKSDSNRKSLHNAQRDKLNTLIQLRNENSQANEA